MRKGIFAWFGYEIPYDERFRTIKAAGFDTVLLDWSEDFPENGKREANAEKARSYGLAIENGHLSFENINDIWLDGLNGQERFARLQGDIVSAAEHGVPVLVIHVSSTNNPPPLSETGLSRFGRLIGTAAKHNMKLAFENLRKPEYLFAVLGRYDCATAGFCYDVGHRHCLTPDIDYLALYGDRLIALHLHDNDGTVDSHLLPFDGSIDWAGEITALKKTSYRGSLTLEVEPAPVHGDYEKLLKEAANRADRLIEMLEKQ